MDKFKHSLNLLQRLTIASISDYYLFNIGNNDSLLRPEFVKHFDTVIEELSQLAPEKEDVDKKNKMIDQFKLLKEIYNSGNDGYDNFTYVNNGTMNHATFQIIQYNPIKQVYKNYFFNSGLGVNFEDENGKLVHQWKYSNVGEVNPFLVSESKDKIIIERKSDEDELYNTLIENGYSTIRNYFFIEQQLQGNCVMRALLYPIHVIIKLKYKDANDEYLNYLIRLVRLIMIYKNIESIFSDENITYDDKIAAKLFKDLIIDQKQKYHFLKKGNFYQDLIGKYYQSVIEKLVRISNLPIKSNFKVNKNDFLTEFKKCRPESISDDFQFSSKKLNLKSIFAFDKQFEKIMKYFSEFNKVKEEEEK